MTKEKLIELAISRLNKTKKTDIKISGIKDDGEVIHVIIKYPKSVTDRTFGFVASWFDPNDLRAELSAWMIDFFISDKLRETNPDTVIILRFAFYFWKFGLGNKLF